MPFDIKFVILFLVNLIDFSLQGHSAHWTYDDESDWSGNCNIGQQQSPINIIRANTVVDQHGVHIRGHLVMRGYGDIKVSAVNNGHTLQWNVDEEWPAPVLSGGPLRGNYSLAQFHLHWLSEHAIDGLKYPLEIHLVHVKNGLTVDQALARPDGIAVIGILAEVRDADESTSFALRELMPSLPDLIHKTEEPTDKKIIDATRFFSPDMQAYYTYQGSLTTPMCQEAVTWIVMDKPISLADLQFRVLSKVDVGGISNFRSLQPVNRVIYRSSSSMVCPGFIGLLAALNCLGVVNGLPDILKKGWIALQNFINKFE